MNRISINDWPWVQGAEGMRRIVTHMPVTSSHAVDLVRLSLQAYPGLKPVWPFRRENKTKAGSRRH